MRLYESDKPTNQLIHWVSGVVIFDITVYESSVSLETKILKRPESKKCTQLNSNPHVGIVGVRRLQNRIDR